MEQYQAIIDFWVDEIGIEKWYISTDELDQSIRDRFQSHWQTALDGGYLDWGDTALGALGYLILTDQFPRNMFRGDARTFATDPIARQMARRAIAQDFDQQIAEPQRQFFFLPFEHSEDIAAQNDAVAYISTRMKDNESTLLHAKSHREIIKRFGRFPYRNDALLRQSTDKEREFIDQAGYQGILEDLQSK